MRFSEAVALDIDQIEKEINSEQDVDSFTFDADWQNDIQQLEAALDADSLDQAVVCSFIFQ